METKVERQALQCEAVARAALGEPASRSGKELLWHCPHPDRHNHGDRNPSLGVSPEDNIWKCWSENVGAKGGWSLAAFIAGLSANDKPKVASWLRERRLLPDTKPEGGRTMKRSRQEETPKGREVECYDYTNEAGDLLFQVVRYEPKDFRQRRPDGKGGWVWHLECDAKCKCNPKLPPTRRVLYKLPELEKAPRAWPTGPRITSLDTPAYSPSPEAIAKLPYVLVVEGEKDVAAAESLGFVATCNPMGAKKWRDEYSPCLEGARVAVIADADRPGQEHAQQVGASLQGWAASVKVCEIPACKDLAESVSKGMTKDLLLALFSDTPEWKPATGADVLDAAYNYIRKFAKVSEAQARALTLWVAHAFIFRGWGHTPYLHIYSAERGEGKSTVLDTLRALLDVPNVLVHPSLAGLYSDLAEHPQSPQLIDEIDKMFNGRTEHDNDIYGYLNAGFQPGRTIPRVTFVGGKRMVEHFDPFCPKALAGLGETALDDTTRDRSIAIRMEKASWTDNAKRWVEKFHLPEGQQIGAKLSAWCTANAEEASKVDVWCTTTVTQRVIDIWEPLLAIAELAGSNWLEWAKSALAELSTGSRAEHDSIGVKLLKDIRTVYEARTSAEPDNKGVASSDLAKTLAEMEDRPWSEYGKARKPITPAQVARLLARYEIKPREIWIGGQNLRGYEWPQFNKAWEKYVSSDATTSGLASARVADSSTSKDVPTSPKNQGVAEIPSTLAGFVGGEPPSKKAPIRWIRLSELRAMRRGQRTRLAQQQGGHFTGAGLGKAIVRGHETTMGDIGGLERAVLPERGIERATLTPGSYETRHGRK